MELLIYILFSSAVFGGKKAGYFYSLGVVVIRRHRCRGHARTLTFGNTSVIAEDIYLKFRVCSLSNEQSTLSNETIQNAFFFKESCPFSTYTFYPQLSTP